MVQVKYGHVHPSSQNPALGYEVVDFMFADPEFLSYNMVENMFSYRVVYFINFESKSEKHYADTRYTLMLP